MAGTNVYTGSNGTLTLANEDTPEGTEAKLIMEAYEIQTVGRVTGIQVAVATDLEEFHEIGRRHPTSLHPGDIHISGGIQRAYINGALLFLLLGPGALSTARPEPYVQPTFNMTVTLTDPATPGNSGALELRGVKFQDWSYALPEEDFVMENVSFRALTIRVLDRGAPAGGGASAAIEPAFSDGATA
jgi:hypothetical protein